MKKTKLKDFIRAVVDEDINIPNNSLIFLDPQVAIEMLTNKRTELLNILKMTNPDSVQELATKTKRKKQAVNRDLKLLESHNLITMKKNGRKVKPSLNKRYMVIAL
tara:strand:+ start:3393 stop:3710 length:318 start_codon:yes stop_codon:yes gene_type:complete